MSGALIFIVSCYYSHSHSNFYLWHLFEIDTSQRNRVFLAGVWSGMEGERDDKMILVMNCSHCWLSS